MQIKQIDYGSPDYFETLKLRTAILRTPLGKILSAEDTDDEDRQLHFACFSDHTLVACAVIKLIKKSAHAKLRQMAVNEKAQGQGIGKKLILEIEKVLHEKGCKVLELSARKTALDFYKKLGFQASGEYYLEQGIDHVKMQKTI